jgi:hypothetical protein
MDEIGGQRRRAVSSIAAVGGRSAFTREDRTNQAIGSKPERCSRRKHAASDEPKNRKALRSLPALSVQIMAPIASVPAGTWPSAP